MILLVLHLLLWLSPGNAAQYAGHCCPSWKLPGSAFAANCPNESWPFETVAVSQLPHRDGVMFDSLAGQGSCVPLQWTQITDCFLPLCAAAFNATRPLHDALVRFSQSEADPSNRTILGGFSEEELANLGIFIAARTLGPHETLTDEVCRVKAVARKQLQMASLWSEGVSIEEWVPPAYAITKRYNKEGVLLATVCVLASCFASPSSFGVLPLLSAWGNLSFQGVTTEMVDADSSCSQRDLSTTSLYVAQAADPRNTKERAISCTRVAACAGHGNASLTASRDCQCVCDEHFIGIDCSLGFSIAAVESSIILSGIANVSSIPSAEWGHWNWTEAKQIAPKIFLVPPTNPTTSTSVLARLAVQATFVSNVNSMRLIFGDQLHVTALTASAVMTRVGSTNITQLLRCECNITTRSCLCHTSPSLAKNGAQQPLRSIITAVSVDFPSVDRVQIGGAETSSCDSDSLCSFETPADANDVLTVSTLTLTFRNTDLSLHANGSIMFHFAPLLKHQPVAAAPFAPQQCATQDLGADSAGFITIIVLAGVTFIAAVCGGKAYFKRRGLRKSRCVLWFALLASLIAVGIIAGLGLSRLPRSQDGSMTLLIEVYASSSCDSTQLPVAAFGVLMDQKCHRVTDITTFANGIPQTVTDIAPAPIYATAVCGGNASVVLSLSRTSDVCGTIPEMSITVSREAAAEQTCYALPEWMNGHFTTTVVSSVDAVERIQALIRIGSTNGTLSDAATFVDDLSDDTLVQAQLSTGRLKFITSFPDGTPFDDLAKSDKTLPRPSPATAMFNFSAALLWIQHGVLNLGTAAPEPVFYVEGNARYKPKPVSSAGFPYGAGVGNHVLRANFSSSSLPFGPITALRLGNGLIYSVPKESRLDVRGSASLTITWWMKVGQTSEGVVFAFVAASPVRSFSYPQSENIAQHPDLEQLLLRPGSESSNFIGGVIVAVVVHGVSRSVAFSSSVPGQTPFSLEWPRAVTVSLFDEQWHYVAVTLSAFGGFTAAQIYVDGTTSFSNTDYTRCLPRGVTSLPSTNQSTAFLLVNYLSSDAAIFALQVHKALLTRQQIAAMGADPIVSANAVEVFSFRVVAVALFVLFGGFFLINVLQFLKEIVGLDPKIPVFAPAKSPFVTHPHRNASHLLRRGNKDEAEEMEPTKDEEDDRRVRHDEGQVAGQSSKAAATATTQSGTTSLTASSGAWKKLAVILPLFAGTVQSMGLYFSAWKWPQEFQNPFSFYMFLFSLDFSVVFPILPVEATYGAQFAIEILSVLFLLRCRATDSYQYQTFVIDAIRRDGLRLTRDAAEEDLETIGAEHIKPDPVLVPLGQCVKPAPLHFQLHDLRPKRKRGCVESVKAKAFGDGRTLHVIGEASRTALQTALSRIHAQLIGEELPIVTAGRPHAGSVAEGEPKPQMGGNAPPLERLSIWVKDPSGLSNTMTKGVAEPDDEAIGLESVTHISEAFRRIFEPSLSNDPLFTGGTASTLANPRKARIEKALGEALSAIGFIDFEAWELRAFEAVHGTLSDHGSMISQATFGNVVRFLTLYHAFLCGFQEALIQTVRRVSEYRYVRRQEKELRRTVSLWQKKGSSSTSVALRKVDTEFDALGPHTSKDDKIAEADIELSKLENDVQAALDEEEKVTEARWKAGAMSPPTGDRLADALFPCLVKAGLIGFGPCGSLTSEFARSVAVRVVNAMIAVTISRRDAQTLSHWCALEEMLVAETVLIDQDDQTFVQEVLIEETIRSTAWRQKVITRHQGSYVLKGQLKGERIHVGKSTAGVRHVRPIMQFAFQGSASAESMEVPYRVLVTDDIVTCPTHARRLVEAQPPLHHSTRRAQGKDRAFPCAGCGNRQLLADLGVSGSAMDRRFRDFATDAASRNKGSMPPIVEDHVMNKALIHPCDDDDFYVCQQRKCNFAVCSQCTTFNVRDRLGLAMATQKYVVTRLGAFSVLGFIVVIVAQSLYLPAVKSATMVVVCQAELACSYPGCYADLTSRFVGMVLASLLVLIIVGAGLIFLVTAVCYRRKQRLARSGVLKGYFSVGGETQVQDPISTFDIVRSDLPVNVWQATLSGDKSMFKSLYEQFEFKYAMFQPITFLFKIALVAVVLFVGEPDSLEQLCGAAAVEFLQLAFFTFTNPFIDPWIDTLSKAGSLHQLLQLGLMSQYRADTYEDPSNQITARVMFAVALVYIAFVLAVIMILVVVPFARIKVTAFIEMMEKGTRDRLAYVAKDYNHQLEIGQMEEENWRTSNRHRMSYGVTMMTSV